MPNNYTHMSPCTCTLLTCKYSFSHGYCSLTKHARCVSSFGSLSALLGGIGVQARRRVARVFLWHGFVANASTIANTSWSLAWLAPYGICWFEIRMYHQDTKTLAATGGVVWWNWVQSTRNNYTPRARDTKKHCKHH